MEEISYTLTLDMFIICAISLGLETRYCYMKNLRRARKTSSAPQYVVFCL
ncbi:hypothetical protein RchiOBHm_Chr6g0274901 [Rosa chinensis]|uniref:Uncharacterized protein n=1 Tax=Rosa chinensis TaxID=74649 RepID=A0A2P6PRX4_ROSCH|nr:hypothetical protein RchiOBHm_Chr6g0274901 [Rosa chinensis]